MSQQINEEQQPEYQAPPQENLPSVGRALRQAREARSLQLMDIAQALKLGVRQVEALERDDWSVLPGATFIRGFIRNYARLVDIDPAPLMARLDGLLEKPANTLAVPETSPTEISSASKSRDGLVIGIGGLLLVLAGLAYFLLPNDLSALRDNLQGMLDGEPPAVAPETPAAPAQEALFPPDTTPQQLIVPPTPPSETVEAPATAPVPVAAPAPVEPVAAAAVPAAASETAAKPTRLRFALSGASWIEVRDRDDVIVFSQRLPAGSEQEVSGKGPLSVVIGYAPGVSLLAQGKLLDLAPHTRGDVARLKVE